ncbi:copper transport protein ATOX1 [Bradysia coprophila]|uniref:copper transport protein ATOX1 n=1 Tax=Bradysia coprophila TaxID=38358 RepID=UPI00187DBE1F|nr:copper transport protein ATOX1 [Bradysia coprophila]XP_037031639.1 copper transport protein ATOX1 [Bradysia coprophila]
MSVVHEFKVEMTCGGCSSAVQRVLGKLGDKIEDVNIDLDARTVAVKSSMPAEELLEVIKKTGKTTTYVGVKN